MITTANGNTQILLKALHLGNLNTIRCWVHVKALTPT